MTVRLVRSDGKGRRRDGRRGGGKGRYLWFVEEKRRGLAARAFPDRAAAKLGGADRTTEITILRGYNQ
jgi:hypothetical protein